MKLKIYVAILFLLSFAWSGWYILDVSEINPIPEADSLSGAPKVVFGFFLMLCMILGMMANYLWDIFNAGKSWTDVTWRGIVIQYWYRP